MIKVHIKFHPKIRNGNSKENIIYRLHRLGASHILPKSHIWIYEFSKVPQGYLQITCIVFVYIQLNGKIESWLI